MLAVSRPSPVLILAFGASGPLGIEALQVAMCARAGRIEPRPTRLLDRRGNRICAARALAIPDELVGRERLVALGALALREATWPLGRRIRAPIPLLVAAPVTPGEGAGADAELLAALAAASSSPIDPARSAIVRAGNAGFALAAAEALALLEDEATPAVLVGGIDSYYDDARLTALEQAGRLSMLDQQRGITPSEGAAFLLLAREGSALEARGRLRFVASAAAPVSAGDASGASDAGSPDAGSPDGGEVMASLIEAAAQSAGPIGWLLADVNAERRRADAWDATLGRCGAAILEGARRDRWIEELGELGAATGAALAALACAFWEAGSAPATTALIALHAEGPERAVLVLEAPPPPPPPSATRAEPRASRPPAPVSIPPPSSSISISASGSVSVSASASASVPPPSSSTIIAPPPFRASVGVPALHRLAPATSGEAPDEDARPQLRRLARDCLEDLAIFGDLWRQRDEEAGPVIADLEQQVLDNLDALVSLVRRRPAPEAVKELFRCAGEISSPDRGRSFALALSLGCIDDEEGARAAIASLRKAHPGSLSAWEAGLRLASSPEIEVAAARLLRSDRPPLIRIALEVLRARRAADPEAIRPLLRAADARLRAAAARCLASAAPADAVPHLIEALDDPEDAVAAAAAEALLLCGAGAGLSWLRRRLGVDPAAPGALARDLRLHAARLLALAGGEGDLALLLGAAREDPRAAEVLGWFGHPGAIEPLIEHLAEALRAIAAGEPVRGAELAVTRALARITGAVLDPDPAAWRAWWTSRRAALPAARLRRGEPFTLEASLAELTADDTPLGVRRACALELELHLGPAGHVDVDGWIALQREAVARIRAALARGELSPVPPGGYLDDPRDPRDQRNER